MPRARISHRDVRRANGAVTGGGTVTAEGRAEAAHIALGRKGEELAAEHLSRLGLVVLDRNWRCREGELDIIATDGRTLVVCEVKTRTAVGFGLPAEAVDHAKIARLRRLTRRWMSEKQVGCPPVRFDVVSIVWPDGGDAELTHIREAF